MQRDLSDYMEEMVATGAISSHPEGAPALVRYGVREDGERVPREVDTAFARRETSQPTAIEGRGQPARNFSTVFVIGKRPGGPSSDGIEAGRAASTDVHLHLPRVSKRHVVFTTNPDGSFAIADAGSKNGTWVDGRRIPPHQPTPLADGVRVRLGPHKFVFVTFTGLVALVEKEMRARAASAPERPQSRP